MSCWLHTYHLVVLVMMNLLTGVALTDVEELKNESGDTTWHEIMFKVDLELENYFSTLHSGYKGWGIRILGYAFKGPGPIYG